MQDLINEVAKRGMKLAIIRNPDGPEITAVFYTKAGDWVFTYGGENEEMARLKVQRWLDHNPEVTK